MAKNNPEWLVLGEGFADITFSRTVIMGGVKMTSVRMREPTVEDSITTSEMEGSDALREVHAIANLVEHAPDDIRKLGMRDFRRLQMAYLSFID